MATYAKISPQNGESKRYSRECRRRRRSYDSLWLAGSSLCIKNFNIEQYVQFFITILSYLPCLHAPLTTTSLSVILTMIEDHKSNKSKTCGAHFLVHFSTDQDQIRIKKCKVYTFKSNFITDKTWVDLHAHTEEYVHANIFIDMTKCITVSCLHLTQPSPLTEPLLTPIFIHTPHTHLYTQAPWQELQTSRSI